MKVDILICTPDMLHVIWTAAKTCYSSKTSQELWNTEVAESEMLRLADQVIKSGHHSVLEHCIMTYAVSGVSRTLLAQYTRHRIGISFSVKGQRYGGGAKAETPCVIPLTVVANHEAAAIFNEQVAAAQETYRRLKALGIPKEDCRFILPGGTECSFVTTLNLRSLMDIYQKRVVTSGSQWEIKAMVKEFARLICGREPWLELYFQEK